MKIRNGFISNSSSTSFCIYGAKIPGNEADKNYKKIEEMGLSYHQYCQESEDSIVGGTPETIKDDETGKQFKDSVVAKLKEIFGKDFDCNWHTDGWYNG